jgi:serine/threonine protein kinase
MSGLRFKEVKKAREAKRRALGSTAQASQHDLLAEPKQRKPGVTSKSQLFPELAELLPPDTMLFIQESTPPSIHGISLVQEGSATIRKGRDEAGRLVIIKQTALTCESGGRVREREILERFCREVRVLSHTGVLYNDNIVDIVGTKWDALDAGQLLSIFLEYADFGNLAEFQSTHGEITWSQKKKLCLDVAAGLSMLHDCGIFHGDLKPENVLIFCGPTLAWDNEWDEEDHGFCAKLCDFGSSHFDIWNLYGEDVTLYGATPPFTAPEYDFRNQGRLPLCLLSPFDIYVFGMLVWRIALGGKTPLGILTSELSNEHFHGDSEIRWLQDLKHFPDDRFLQLATKTLSTVPIKGRLFYERILKSTLRFKVEDRASTIKKMLHLLDGGEDESLPIIAVDYPR